LRGEKKYRSAHAGGRSEVGSGREALGEKLAHYSTLGGGVAGDDKAST
jgi:hypothetical protein